jgi:DNA (cytosine-5)-methyltransferase 1
MNTLSLFAGGGGLDLGFAAAGFNISFSSDIDEHSCKTLYLNQNKFDFYSNHVVICDDIANLSLDKIFYPTSIH